MAIEAVLFDLDGTLLSMDQDAFISTYLKKLAKKAAPYGYDPKELIETLWKGTGAMVRNDGTSSNEEVFWKYFSAHYGQKALSDQAIFDAFYQNEYTEMIDHCACQPEAAKTVHALQARGVRLVLATNPVFPAAATSHRIRWAGLSEADFEWVTTYENIGYCKPNPAYYVEIAKHIGVSPEHCLMVGNDVQEDMIASSVGMRVFLMTKHIIDHNHTDLSQFPHGDFDALHAYLDSVL